MLSQTVTQNWWALALRGLVAVLFGIAALIWPALTLATLIILFAAYALVDGLFALIGGVQARSWFFVIEGIVSIIVGVLAFIWPGITALLLLAFIAAWAIITGIIEIVGAIQLRRIIANEWLLILGGVLSILFGIFLLARPGAGALAVIWAIGAYALVFGITLIALAFRLRGHGQRLGGGGAIA
jgi:uncharacterized membrane protein HdeD (DUF308 family)